MNLTEFRNQYPQYDDLDDVQVTKSLHDKFYEDIPYEDFKKQFWQGTAMETLPKPELPRYLTTLPMNLVLTDEEWEMPTRNQARSMLQGELRTPDEIRKNFKDAVVYGWERAGVKEVKGLAGNVLAAGEILAPEAFDYKPGEKVFDPVTGKTIPGSENWGTLFRPRNQVYDFFGRRRTNHGDSLGLAIIATTHKHGKPLREWSKEMLAGVDRYYEQHPEEAVQLEPGVGYAETLQWLIDHPEDFLQLTVESLPFMLRMVLGYKLGGPHGVGKPAAIAAVAFPVAGDVYAEARKEGTDIPSAMGESMLVGLGEGAIEEAVFGKLFGLSRNIKKIVAKGLPKILWEGAKIFFRGTAEEGSQEFNRNFWRWVFTDREQEWFENVPQSMALGGPMELAMGTGFAAAGMATGPSITKEKQLLVVDKIRKSVDKNPDLNEEQKKEWHTELDQVVKDIEFGYYDVAGASAERIRQGTKAKYEAAVEEAGLKPEPQKQAKPREVAEEEVKSVEDLKAQMQERVDEAPEEQRESLQKIIDNVQPQQTELSPEQRLAIPVLEALGKKIVYTEGGEFYNGAVREGDTGTVYVDKGTSNPVIAVAFHEVHHQLKSELSDTKEYKRYVNTLRLSMTPGALKDYAAKVNRNNKRYGLPEQSEDEIFDEFTGDFMGDAAKTQTFWKILVEKDANLFRKVAKISRRILNNLWDTDKKTFKLIHADTIERNIQNAAKLAKVKLVSPIPVGPAAEKKGQARGPQAETRAGPVYQMKVFRGKRGEMRPTGVKFYSTDKSFAQQYGERGEVEEVEINLGRTFDIAREADFNKLAKKVGPITDPYNDTTYKDFSEYSKSEGFGSDTWEITEEYLDDIKALGYDSAVIGEGGVENFAVFEKPAEKKPTKLEQERAIQKLINMGRNPVEARRKIEAFPNAKALKNFMRLIETEGGATIEDKGPVYQLREGTIRKSWFGENPAVVDKNGKPEILYHGTYQDIGKFKARVGRDIGIHLAASAEQAMNRLEDTVVTKYRGAFTQKDYSGANIIPVVTNLQNPYDVVSDLGAWGDMEMLYEYFGNPGNEGILQNEWGNIKNPADFVLAMIAKGYDGIKYQNAFEGIPGRSGFEENEAYIVFNPVQIKSAITGKTLGPGEITPAYLKQFKGGAKFQVKTPQTDKLFNALPHNIKKNASQGRGLFISPDGKVLDVTGIHHEGALRHAKVDGNKIFKEGTIRVNYGTGSHAINIETGDRVIMEAQIKQLRTFVQSNETRAYDMNISWMAYNTYDWSGDQDFKNGSRSLTALIARREKALKAAKVPVGVGPKFQIRGDTYDEAIQKVAQAPEQGVNVYIKQAPGKDNSKRILTVQMTSDLFGSTGQGDDVGSQYFSKLYSGTRKGYVRPGEPTITAPDFWEIPVWITEITHQFPDRTDLYVVRNMEEAKRFLKEQEYGLVTFSALDMNKNRVKELADAAPGQVAIGGYVENLGEFFTAPNINTYNSMRAFVESRGKQYKRGYNYKLFTGTQTIPRLALSEGCKYHCVFCDVQPHGETITLSSDEIDQQVNQIIKLKHSLVYLNDKTFGQTQNYRKLPTIYNKIKKANPDFKGFIVQTTPADMNLTKFPKSFLKASGIKYVELGVETFNDNILKAWNKPGNEYLIEKATQWLRNNRIALIPNIMVGGTWVVNKVKYEESAKTYQNTLDYLERNKDIISHINIYNLAVYDNTKLAKDIGVEGDIDLDENVIKKSYHQNHKVHSDWYNKFAKFGLEALSARPVNFQIKPWYYSKLEQAVDKMPPKMTTQALEGYLKGKGVKDAEMFWRGIYDLAEGKITKEQLNQHLAEHDIVVDEVWKSQRGVDDYGNAYEEDLEEEFSWDEGEKIEPDSDYVAEQASERMEEDKALLLENEKERILNVLRVYHSDEELKNLEDVPIPSMFVTGYENDYHEARERYLDFFEEHIPARFIESKPLPGALWAISDKQVFEEELKAQTVARDVWDDEGLWEELRQDDDVFDPYLETETENAWEQAATEYNDSVYNYRIYDDTYMDGEVILYDAQDNYIDSYNTLEEAKRAAYDIELEKTLEHEPTPAEETEVTPQGSFARPEEARFAEPGYREPGGENYYELVLTLRPPGENEIEKLNKEYYQIENERQKLERGSVRRVELNAKQNDIQNRIDNLRKGRETYGGGHYKEENVLVHVRFNTRIDTDGKKVLFIEEIQSDWAQRGRDLGFLGTEWTELPKDIEVKAIKGDPSGSGLGWAAFEPSYPGGPADHRITGVSAAATKDEGIKFTLDWLNTRRLPDMPFKETGIWSSLALKRILHHAAEHDFDKVAWTTGEMQVKRWSGALQKAVDTISYFPETKMLVTTKGGKENFRKEMPQSKVQGIIGGNLAESLFRSQDEKTGVYGLSGDSLKIGGESMRIEYDIAIPKFMSKLGKKYNAKVETTTIDTSKPPQKGYKAAEVQSITISPQLKTMLKEGGLPLFQTKPFEQSELAPLINARDLAMNLNDLAEFKNRLKWKRASVEQMQAELNDFINRRLPRKHQAIPLSKLRHISIHHRDETNKKKMVEIIGTVEGIVTDVARRDALQSLKNTWRKTKKKYGGRSLNKLPDDIRGPLLEKMEEINLINLTEGKKEDIAKAMQRMKELAVDLSQGVMNIENLSPDDLSNLEEAIKLPSARLVQLQRLSGKKASEMMPADIRVIEEGIQNVIHEYETKQTLESEARREEFANAKSNIKKEVVPTRKALRQRKKEARGKFIDITKGDKNRFVRGIIHTESAHLETLIEQISSRQAEYLKKYLVDDLYAGQDRMYQQLFAAIDYLKREMAAMKMTRREIAALQNKVKITLGKRNFKVPLDYLVSLDRNVARPENLRDLLRTRGIKIGSQYIPLSEEDRERLLPQLQAAVQHLTDKQRQFGMLYNSMNALINAPALNEISLQLDGHELARDPLYFPTHRYLPKKLPGRAIETARAIEQQGRYQAKVGSIQPLEIKPFTEELITAVQSDATYVGTALPFKNARTILHDGDIQQDIIDAGHKKALKAVMTILKRAQGMSTDKNVVEMYGQKVMSKAVKSILSLRFSTIGTQVMSVPAAMSEIDPHHFIGLFPPSPQLIKKLKQDPFFRMRWDGGRIDIDVGNIMAKHTLDTLLFGKYPFSEKTLRGLVHGDQVAIGYIFKAARREIAAKNPNLKGAALNQAAIQRTKQVMRRTQPMWDILNRSSLGSSPNVLLRSLLIFRSAREAQLNIGIRANNDLLKGGGIYQWSKAMASLTGSAIAVAAWKVLFKWAVTKGILVALGIKRPEDEEVVQKTVAKLATDTGKNVISLVPFGGTISNWIEAAARSAFTGKRRLPSNYNRNIYENMLQSFGVAVVDSLAGWYKYATGNEEGGKKAIHNAIDNAINFTALISGLPYSGPRSEFYKPIKKAMEQEEVWEY